MSCHPEESVVCAPKDLIRYTAQNLTLRSFGYSLG